MYFRVILCALAVGLQGSAFAKELMSYEEAENAINTGHRITYVIDWEKCETNYPDVKLDNVASWTPEGYVVKKGLAIASRGMTYSHTVRPVPTLPPVYQAYEYIFYKDKGLEITNRFLNPKSYEEVIPAARLLCKLGEAFKVYRV